MFRSQTPLNRYCRAEGCTGEQILASKYTLKTGDLNCCGERSAKHTLCMRKGHVVLLCFGRHGMTGISPVAWVHKMKKDEKLPRSVKAPDGYE